MPRVEQRACHEPELVRCLQFRVVMRVGELLIRFGLGGSVVSLFAALGGAFKPKTFAGLFGAAPTVALGSLALAFSKEGAAEVATLARSMAWAAPALLVYSAVCMLVVKWRGLPVWLGAGLAWASWGLVAAVLFWSFSA
jgi:uncharacterized membrane protein (GlpM family)